MILFGILKIFMWLLLYYVETAGGLVYLIYYDEWVQSLVS